MRKLTKILFMENQKDIKTMKSSVSKEKNYNLYAIVTGALAGFFNGLFGGGGGMIVVPMLIHLLSCPQKKAHATAILIILPLSIVSGLFYLSFGALNLSIAIPTGVGVVLGGCGGAFLLSKLSSRWVLIIFSVVMAVAGVKMLLF